MITLISTVPLKTLVNPNAVWITGETYKFEVKFTGYNFGETSTSYGLTVGVIQ
jgi:hypothetical protein